jgi:Fic family protein
MQIGNMYQRTSQMEPLLPDVSSELEDMAREIVSRSASLGGQLHPITRNSVVELLRITNSYYSNLIEGHSTHPIDIERAMQQDYSSDPARRDLQLESLAHIDSQRAVEARLRDEPTLNAASPVFITWLHSIFYERLPQGLKYVKDKETGEKVYVTPGELRRREVIVGRHVGPAAATLPAFLDRFSNFYHSGAFFGLKPLVAAAASHHRLMWIHPFLDGNGRVARLYTDACLYRYPLLGYGLWNVSRGLAYRKDAYMAALAAADAHRRNDTDGRGNLSNEGLVNFCHFFFDICLDQIDFMAGLLQLDGIIDRIKGYVNLRHRLLIPDSPLHLPPLKPQAAYMLQEAFLRGHIARGEILRVSGLAERTGRILLGQLLTEGLLVSDSPKGAVRIGMPTTVAAYLFPDIYPRRSTW